ncbi:MAG TPA: carboxypeptidase regulatory-like domain-containing protein [Chloroflexi bacterium]|nr:carboxypeptidase regulatory-like domain-containing protein [Chloroflexota bacterium]
MRRGGVALCAALIFLLVPQALVLAQGEGVIEGQVLNGTSGAPLASVAELEIELYQVFQGSLSLVGTTTTDWQGRFTFEGLDTGAEHTYRFQLEYQGITYGAESAFPSDEDLIRVVATVYETTTSDSGLVVEQQHVLVDFEAGVLSVRELCVLNNASDTIYVGDGGTTAEFSLPDGALDLAFSDSAEAHHFVETEGGFAYVRPIMPGQREVLYSYEVPYDGGQLVLSREITYPAARFDLMVADVGVQVESAQLEYQSLTGGGETAYLHFQGEDLPAGQEIAVAFAGAPRMTEAPVARGPALGLPLQQYAPALALLMVVMGAAVPWAQLRLSQRSGLAVGESDSGSGPGMQQRVDAHTERDELLRLVADLDDAYEEGSLNEETYGQLRERMRKRLREVWPE